MRLILYLFNNTCIFDAVLIEPLSGNQGSGNTINLREKEDEIHLAISRSLQDSSEHRVNIYLYFKIQFLILTVFLETNR